jgi:hypothetical protein
LNITVPHARKLWLKGAFPGCRLGHRTLRFCLADVVAALNARGGRYVGTAKEKKCGQNGNSGHGNNNGELIGNIPQVNTVATGDTQDLLSSNEGRRQP